MASIRIEGQRAHSDEPQDTVVTLQHPYDTVVVQFPAEWDVAVIEKKAMKPFDPLYIYSTVGFKVKVKKI